MTAALGFLAAALSISVVWPQVWRSCRQGRTRGLSPTGTWLAVGLNLCWLTFGVLTGDPAQIATHTVVGAGNTAVLVALLVTQPHLRSGRALLRTATGALGLAALAAGSLAAVLLRGATAHRRGCDPRLDRLPRRCGRRAAPAADPADATATWTCRGCRRPGGDWAPDRPPRGWATGWMENQPTVWLSAGFGLLCAVRRLRGPAGPADDGGRHGPSGVRHYPRPVEPLRLPRSGAGGAHRGLTADDAPGPTTGGRGGRHRPRGGACSTRAPPSRRRRARR